MNKVTVVIVTYNRLEMLKKCLNSLKNQTLKINQILLIDNASNDGTSDWVKVVSNDFPKIEYLRLDENLGGAGGFRKGLLRAFEFESDYIWLMDDDVEADINCLDTLVTLSSGVAAVQPTRINPDGTKVYWHHHFDPFSTIKIPTNLERNKDYFVNVNVSCFEGLFMPFHVAKNTELPFEDFFISEDDTLYGFLLSLRYPLLYTSKAIIRRQAPPPVGIDSWKLYYCVRNRIWIALIIKDKLLYSGAVNLYAKIMLGLNIAAIGWKALFIKQGFKKFIYGVKDGFFSKPIK
jgi:GT2 family glycosyltransferase